MTTSSDRRDRATTAKTAVAAPPRRSRRPAGSQRAGVVSPPRPAPGRPAWTEESIRAALTAFLAGRDLWPTYHEFISAGAKGLRDAVKRIHGAEWWAAEMGLAGGERRQGGMRRWNDVTIRAALREFLAGRRTWPSQQEFRRAGRGGLSEALRHHGGSRRWAREMGVAPPPRVRGGVPAAKPRSKRSTPRWSDERIARELTAFLVGQTEWPRYIDFVDAGQKSLYQAVRGTGGPAWWAEQVGVSYERRRGGLAVYWTEERVRERLGRMLDGRTEWPTTNEFRAAGEQRLLAAARRLGGVNRWMIEFGVDPAPLPSRPSTRLAPPRAWTDEAVAAAVSPLVARLGRWPTKGEFRAAGLSAALAAVYDHGGSAEWQRRLGVTPAPSRSPVPDRTQWTTRRIDAELRELCRGRSRWPTMQEFEELDAMPLYRAASKRGGIARWRRRLGL